MADKLYEVLEYIKVRNGLYKTFKMSHEVVDGVLHFMMQFNYHVIKEAEAVEKMNKLSQEVGVKRG